MPTFTKNIASTTPIAFDLRDASGNFVAGTPTVTVSKDNGTYATGAGSLNPLSGTSGEWGYVPTQGELNCGCLKIKAALSGAVTATLAVYPEPDFTQAKAANLDAAISTRSTYAGGDTAGTATLLNRLTDARATKLDNLDAAISSRSVLSADLVWAYATRTITNGATGGISKSDVADVLNTQGLTTDRASKLDRLDATVSSRSTLSATDVWAAGSRSLTTFGSLPDNAAAAVWAYLNRTITGGGGITSADLASALNTQGLTTQRTAKLDHLDADITSRNATAPDNAGIAAIKLKTDTIPAQPAAIGSKMVLDLNQLIPNDLGTGTIGEAMQAARAQGYGSWKIVGNSLKLFAPDGTTVLKTFALDSSTNPTSRTAQ